MAQLFTTLHYNNRCNPYSIICSYYNLSRALFFTFFSTRINFSVVKFCCVEYFILYNPAFALSALTHLYVLKDKYYLFSFYILFSFFRVGWYGAVVKAPCLEACMRSGELCRLCVRNAQLTQFS